MNKSRKRNYDEAFPNEDYVYGIITTSVDCIYIKLSNNNISIMPISKAQHLDLEDSSIESIELEVQLNKVVGIIV